MSKSSETQVKRIRKPQIPLATVYDESMQYEIGVDEAGRGPLFGRVYVSAVVLPKNGEFEHTWMKDSKKFTNKEKMRDVANYIKTHSVAWHTHFIEAAVIDKINILQAVMMGMHECIRNVIDKLDTTNDDKKRIMLLIDGNYFTPHIVFDTDTETMREVPYETIEGGDGKYTCIAAASILSKMAHDDYIAELCVTYPELVSRYSLDTHVGYGTKKHLEGIQTHGITQWHRKSFGCCKTAKYAPIQVQEPTNLPLSKPVEKPTVPCTNLPLPSEMFQKIENCNETSQLRMVYSDNVEQIVNNSEVMRTFQSRLNALRSNK